MANHPNRSRKHRGVEMIRTDTICLDNNRRTYELRGEIEKSGQVRPFLTTAQECREYIDRQLDIREFPENNE